jgi:SAM-dependent methyltransferase
VGALALDIASNDGTLLEAFKNCGLRPIGVDPAENLAREANARGLETLCDYWSLPLAEQILSTHGAPQIITAANVFAHADDLRSFCDAVRACLAPTGIFAIECPYVLDFLKRYEFDTAYHEHLSYIGLLPLARLLSRSGLELFDVEYFPDIHGGSIRAISAPAGVRRPTPRLQAAMEAEKSFGLFDAAVYDEFGRKVLENRSRLRETVASLRGGGRTIWAYGASAKGNTLMNFFGLGNDQVPRVIDDNPKKWGLLTPGSRMEIIPIDSLASNEVDFLILLAWNFENEIRARCRKIGYRGRFLIPVPEVRIAETG